MKKGLMCCIFLLCIFAGYAQKKVITNDLISRWPVIDAPFSLSEDGKFCTYSYNDGELSSFISSTDGKYTQNMGNCTSMQFAYGGKKLICIKGGDSLLIFDLQTKTSKYYFPVSSYTINRSGFMYRLCFKSGNKLIVKDLNKKHADTLLDVSEYVVSEDGKKVAFVSGTFVKIIDSEGKVKAIYNSGTPSGLTFDKSCDKLAFNVLNNEEHTICYYDVGMVFAKVLIGKHSKGINPDLAISRGPLFFSEDGKRVFFNLSFSGRKSTGDNDVITDMVDIWHYKDNFFQSQQLKASLYLTNFRATTLINEIYVVQLESSFSIITGKVGNRFAIVRTITNDDEANWRKQQVPKYSLVQLEDGLMISVPNKEDNVPLYLSPSEKFVTWLDKSKELVCYEIKTSKTRTLTTSINYPICSRNPSRSEANYFFSQPKWLANDNMLIISDNYDFWSADPLGIKAPINITKGYGRTNGIQLRFMLPDQIVISDQAILTGMDVKMNNGFFKLNIHKTVSFSALGTMEPFLYYHPSLSAPLPVKANNTDLYLLTKQSAERSPVLLCTRDFKKFNTIAITSPSKEYNWLTAELIHWPMIDKQAGTGILYKPEDFDPSKKYPVIFNYYEVRSKELHVYLKPSLSHGDINIPWYVSNGYLVFVPDIIHPIGKTGEAALSTVTSAAMYLSTLPYVNAQKMGLQGHSFGGYETLFIITHSDVFAAAQTSAAPSDFVSMYGAINFGDKSLAFMCETGQINLGVTLWESREVYIKNSPLFYADRVKTPLMMLQNKKDDAVPFSQGVEMYTALRRLRKRVWMLQYDSEHHAIFGQNNQMDYTIRQQQFFNHYLKNMPAPLWMAEGVDAKDKGRKSGLQLDSLNRTP